MRVGATGLVYDGVDLSETFQIVDMNMPVLPKREAVTHDLAQRPGSYFAGLKVGTREIRVKLRLDAETRDPMGIYRAWLEASATINKSEPRPLWLNDHRMCHALLVGETPIEDEAYYGVVELNFVCFDPYLYGPTRSVAVEDGEAASFHVGGSVEAWPTLELEASATTVKVTDVSTGQYVLLGDVEVGATVTVDMERQVCTKGTGYAPYDLDSDFFAVSGDAQVKVEGASGTLSYVERWL